MRRLLRLAFLFLLAGLAARAAANTPPRAPPDPVRLEAARALVRVLPIRESFAPRMDGGSAALGYVFRAVRADAALLHPSLDLERFGAALDGQSYARTIAALPRILPEATEEIATAYAYRLSVAELQAATAYYGAPDGRYFAMRMVDQDFAIIYPLQTRLYQLVAPEVGEMVAEVEARERLRERINAGR